MKTYNIPKSLLTRILDGKCVLFLGAGATISSGGASGSELGKYIYTSLGDIGIDFNENLAIYTQKLVNNGYRDEIERSVRERFSGLKPSDKFCKLADIPWKAIYTTNYDDLIEQSYKKQNFYNCVVNSPQCEGTSYGHADVPLYKINGNINTHYVDTNPLIITMNDLKDKKKTRRTILQRLMKDMNDTFIFVGYSFQDKNEIVTTLLDELSENERWESVKEKYVITPSISENTKLILESYKISHIPCTGDEFFDYVSIEYQSSYLAKLKALGKTLQNNTFLKNAEPVLMQYIIDSFEVYEPTADYPVDGKNYYRGGNPNWGIIKNNYDVPRTIYITNSEKKMYNSSTDLLYSEIIGLLNENGLKKIKIEGPAASGKTTTIYRMAYDLFNHGFLPLIFKQQAKYKEGLLSSIYDITKLSFVVLTDNVFIDSAEIIKMLNEAKKNALPLAIIVTTRNSDWSNKVSSFNKSVFEPFDLVVTMEDFFNKAEAEIFVDKMESCGLITINNPLEKKGYIKRINKSRNIVDTLFELTENNHMKDSIAGDYDSFKPETQFAYGVVSLVYKYGYKLRWEILQRTIASEYEFTWNDFVDKILHSDAKGNFYEEEVQGNYYILGRSRNICDLISNIHFGGNYSLEVDTLSKIIDSCATIDSDERFMSGLLYSIVKDNATPYMQNQIIDLLDKAISVFINQYTKSAINHMKGEYYIKASEYSLAINCFEANVHNELNEEYSLHSLGKTYFYKAQKELDSPGKFRVDIDAAIEKLFEGLEKYKRNEFYFGILISIFSFLHKNGKMSERDSLKETILEEKGIQYLGKELYDSLKDKWNSGEDFSME